MLWRRTGGVGGPSGYSRTSAPPTRYGSAVAPPHGKESGRRRVLEEVRNFFLYQAKLPAQATLLAPAGSSSLLDALYCVCYVPLQGDWAAMLRATGEQLGRSGGDLADLVPERAPEALQSAFRRAVQGFDFQRGSREGAPGTSFVSYLRKRMGRYLGSVRHHLRAAAARNGMPLSGDFEGSAKHVHATPEGMAQVSSSDLPLGDLGSVLRIPPGPGGEQYVSTARAAIWLGLTPRRVQQLAIELGGRRAGEVFPDGTALLEADLRADQWLFPVDRLTKTRRP